MDSLTHIALGACIGEAVFSKRLGKKALLLGAVAQSFPDLDGLAAFWLTPTESLLFHRGISHSFFFEIVAALALAFLTQRIFRQQGLSLIKLFVFFCSQMWLHSLLDTCNDYGTGLLEPFSHQRFSFNLLFVADPLFTISMVMALVALLILKIHHPARKKWLLAGLLLPCCYLFYAVSNKTSVNKQVEKSLAAQQVPHHTFITKPTAFNTWLWYVMVPADSGFYIGYRSVFDDKNQVTPFVYYPQNKQLLQKIDTSAVVKELITFADNYYTVENKGDSLIFNVLRFGRIAGWDENLTYFSFQYYLNQGFDNSLLVQRGRIKELTWKTFIRMYHRIKGKKTD